MKNHSINKYTLLLVLCCFQQLVVGNLGYAQATNNSDNNNLKLIGSFNSKENLNKSIQKLKEKGLQTVVETSTTDQSTYRLEFGPFNYKRDASEWIKPLKNEGFSPSLVQRKYDFVIVLGEFTQRKELLSTMKKAKSLGYSLVREVVVENKTTLWSLYTKSKILPKNKVAKILKNSQSIANYNSKQQALKQAKKINRDKKSRAFVIQKKRRVISYFLGPYPNQREADKAIRKLHRGQVEHSLKWDKDKLAYIITIKKVDRLSSNKELYNKLLSLGIKNPKKKFTTQVNYEVVVQPRRIKPNNESLTKSKPKQKQNKWLEVPTKKKKKTILTTLSDSRAKQKVKELEQKGVDSEVQQQIEDVTLQALVLTKINSWNKARSIAKKLKSLGIDAFPISNRHNKNFSVSVGYSVSVGIYQDKENITKQLNKVRELGYTNAEIVNYKKQITSYKVVAEKPKVTVPNLEQSSNIKQTSIESSDEESPLFDGNDEEEMFVFLDTDSLTFGDNDNSFNDISTKAQKYQFAFEDLSSSYNVQPDNENVDGIFTTRIQAFATAKFSSEWDAKISFKAKYWNQQGFSELDYSELLLNDAFVRYRGSNYRITLGNQTALWGRLDGNAPTDMMSTRDLSFLIFDNELEASRISDFSLRIESYFEQYKLDVLYTPKPRETLVPKENSSFSFINKSSGRILGIEPVPVLQQLAILGTIEDTQEGESSWGLRLSHAGENLDYAITAQHSRIQTPFYSINPETLFHLFNGNDIQDAINLSQGSTFLVYQPETDIFGGDFGWVEGASTIRGEMAWVSDYPIIRESTLQFDTTEAINWGIGLETYPEGTEDTRIIIQIIGTQILDDEDTLGELSTVSMNGQLETFFMRDRWRTRINFLASLNKKDFYLNPELSYIGLTNNEFFLAFHYFEGDADTLGGFFEKSNTLSLGWKRTFN